MLRRTPNWPALEELDNATLDDAPALEELAQSATETLAPETLADAISRLADFLNETETLAPAPGTLDDATALEELRRSEFNLVFY